MKIEFQHVDGEENTTLVMDHDAAYVLALGIIHAQDRGFEFEEWKVNEQAITGEQFYRWAINFITPAEDSADFVRAYGERKAG